MKQKTVAGALQLANVLPGLEWALSKLPITLHQYV